MVENRTYKFGKTLVVNATTGETPKREPDVPKIETHISAVIAKKDGKLWIKHQTTITDWKPLGYYEKVIETATKKASER